jgi:hypothetical protein
LQKTEGGAERFVLEFAGFDVAVEPVAIDNLPTYTARKRGEVGQSAVYTTNRQSSKERVRASPSTVSSGSVGRATLGAGASSAATVEGRRACRRTIPPEVMKRESKSGASQRSSQYKQKRKHSSTDGEPPWGIPKSSCEVAPAKRKKVLDT